MLSRRNGIRRASANIVGMTDDDTTVNPDDAPRSAELLMAVRNGDVTG